VLPGAASYHPALREFILPYEAVRLASDPEAMLMDFLQSTYDAAANLGTLPRGDLERNETALPLAALRT
jgi:Family of unknown function (DUF5996)